VTATSADGLTATSSISYAVAAAPSATITAPADGGTCVVGQSVATSFTCTEGTGGPGLSSCDDSAGTATTGGGSGHLDTSTPDSQTYRVSATSSDGQTGSTQITYTVKASAQGSAPRPKNPILTGLKLTPRSFLAATSGSPVTLRSDAGVLIRYRDTLAARTTFKVLRCVGRHGRCSKRTLVGTFSHRDHAGANRLRFTCRLHGRALNPGRYVLDMTATLAGQRSPILTTSLTIFTPPLVCRDPDGDGPGQP
jgi:hypothetical protein